MIAASRQVKTGGMDMRANSELAGQIAAALDWWREAGVDGDLRDEPQRWIAPAIAAEPAASDAPPAAASAAPDGPPAPPAVIDRRTWPQDLDRFAPWWLSEPWLDEGRTSGRVAPRGAAGAELMILVAEPEREDSDTLLSGPRGRLFAAMLAAMGLEPAAAYVASVLPRHMPHADWEAIAARGFGELARHHIALAAPKRLIVFGNNTLALLGHDLANKPGAPTEFEHGDGKLPLLAARDLAALLERPRWKAVFWQSWLEWTAEVPSDAAAPGTESI